MKTVHIDISSRNSVRQAISELQNVKKEWQRKADLCSETIAAMLADEIQKNLDNIGFTDDMKDVKTHTELPLRSELSAVAVGNRVIVSSAEGEIAFVEFGAGIYHNQGVNNPLADSIQGFDTHIGSFGKGQGNKKYWFVRHNIISCGTPAYMPIYNALETIKPMIPTIARQVFV